MAVYGPFSRTTEGVSFYKKQTWYRQTAPYELRLPYTLDTYYALKTNTMSGWSTWAEGPLSRSSLNNQAIMMARERLNSELGSDASLAVTIAQWQQAESMFNSRALQLLRFANAVRRGRFGDAAKALSINPSPRSRGRVKDTSSAWLEWSYGWVPLVTDIGNTIEVFQGPLPPTTVRSRGRSDLIEQTRTSSQTTYRKFEVKCQMISEVSVSNPNLWMANQLGFVNPAVVAWELIPFSFVVDWFIPVGNFARQFTDFVGLSLKNPATTMTGLLTFKDEFRRSNGTWDRRHKERFQFQRTGAISSYRLQPHRFAGVSLQRGANAIALLIQQLR